MTRRFKIGVVTLGTLALVSPTDSRCQEPGPLVTDRPDFTESAFTVDPGRFQVELGYTYLDQGEVTTHAFGELLARVGILRRLEARVGLNSFAVSNSPDRSVQGLEDVSIGVKAGLYEPPAGESGLLPVTALIIGVTVPTGSDAIDAADGVQPGAILALAWTLTSRLSLGGNLGWRYGSVPGDRYHELRSSASLGLGIADRLGGFVEWYGIYPESPGGPVRHVIDSGLAYLISSDVQIDARIGVDLASSSDTDWFTGIGLAFRL